MSTKKPALGKGLEALISNVNEFSGNKSPEKRPANPASITEIAIDSISANPFQPRSNFEQSALEELAASIRQFGIIQPITVRKTGDKYQIISGERRFRASKLAGLESIPAYIKETDNQGMIEMAIVENIQRENLDAIEIALSFQRLIDECGLTQEVMADKVGKKRATVTNYLRLLKLPPEIQASIRDGKISMGHAKAILSLPEESGQKALCSEIIKKDLSVRQAESRVQSFLKETSSSREKEIPSELPDTYYKVLEIIGRYFDNNISLKRSENGKGKITIQFSSDKEVESFLNAIESIN